MRLALCCGPVQAGCCVISLYRLVTDSAARRVAGLHLAGCLQGAGGLVGGSPAGEEPEASSAGNA